MDYVIQHRNSIVPIEVKSGSAGKLKSLRVNKVKSNLNDGKCVEYTLVSIPFYLTENIDVLLESKLKS